MMSSFQPGIVFVTEANQHSAQKLAETLVSERLAACVSLQHINSIYRWKNEIQKDKEIQLIIKTDLNKSELLINRIKDLHSYEIPEIVMIPIASGLPAYLNWMAEQVEPIKD